MILANAEEKLVPLERAHWSTQQAQDLQIPYSSKQRASVPVPSVSHGGGGLAPACCRGKEHVSPQPCLQLSPRDDQRDTWPCQNNLCHAAWCVAACPAEVYVPERLSKENQTPYSPHRMLKDTKSGASGM